MPARHTAPVLAVAVLLGGFAAGCVTPSGEVLLQETIRVGERLFDFGNPSFMERGVPPEQHGRTVRPQQPLEVGPEIARIGVSFLGLFAWDNSSAVLTLTRDDGATAMLLEARPGLQDSTGTIGALFEFHETVPASPGAWEVRMEARGNVTSVEFSIHAIPAGASGTERIIDLSRAGAIDVLVDARGWGRSVDARIVHPDGSSTPIRLEDARDDATFHGRVAAGEHRLVLDTTDWGGTLIVRAVTA